MSDRLTATAAWNRARALKLHEHFQAIAIAVQGGAGVTRSLKTGARMLDGLVLRYQDKDGEGEMRLTMSYTTMRREWDYWHVGGREGAEVEAHIRRPEALLCAYKAGCGGAQAMPRKLKAELQRRMTHTTGGRDKHGKAPISEVWKSLRIDFANRVPLPGIDYDDYPVGAEFPWSYSTVCRKKAPRGLRALGNRGASAHKAVSAYVSLDYSLLRKGELYTLDDVRLDIVCSDEATGDAVEVVCYIFMEVASRSIVGYVMKPARAIKQEDVDELLAHMLQVPGYGIGVGYVTHLLFERGTVACSEAAQMVLEGVTHGRIKVHRTGMVGGVRWSGAPADKARGNAAGKAAIESFNRKLHYMLLHLPGQRGNLYANQPENLGDLGQAALTESKEDEGKKRKIGSLIQQAEELAKFEIAAGRRLRLKLPMLRLMELNAAVAEAIKRHNSEAGHDYRGHGSYYQEETAPGVWEDTDLAPVRVETAFAAEVDEDENAEQPTSNSEPANGKARSYVLKGAAPMTEAQRRGIYWELWNKIAAIKPGLDRHALTRRALGCNPKVAEMTPEQFTQITRVFAAIARDASPDSPTSHPTDPF